MPRPRYYITTPIYYATDEPHVGHAYCTIAADAAARYRRLTGHEVHFLTGTDEHGQKMERQAARRGLSPRALADETAARYRETWPRLHVGHDDFIRTTEERHRRGVLEMWRRMVAAGDLYKGDYEGLYCVSCEAFYLEKELVDGRCPDHGIPPEPLRESGWFFRLSAYQERLLEHYEKHPEFIRPDVRRNEVRSFVRQGLRDLCVSRASTRWGIPVPGDPEHVIYVWVDALTNYLSAVGFPGEEGRWWPADVHLVGKDILRFHAVYWPAFLMSAGVELPRQVYGHGWWLFDGRKISKSSGGAPRFEPLLECVGADAVRYLLLREVPFGLDGSFSDEGFVARYNADLANDFGNLVSRTLQMIARYCGGRVPQRSEGGAGAAAPVADVVPSWRRHFDRLDFSLGLDEAWAVVRAGNQWIDRQAPWKLAKDPARRSDLEHALYTAAELVRLAATLLWPVMPRKCEAVREALGLAPVPEERDLAPGAWSGGTRVRETGPLFPRVDGKQWLAGATPPPGRERNVSDERTPAPAPTAAPASAASGAAAQAREATAPAAPAGAAEISVDEFFRADLRVARVKTAERVEGAKKLLRLVVDLGSEERQIVAGIAEKYAPEALVGKHIVVVANLKPAVIRGVESRGMLLAASLGGLPVVATFEEPVPPGTKVK